jgi:hypothetical protein
MKLGPVVYILSALISLWCAVLLLRAYFRVRKSLLLWSGLCFCGLTASNSLIFVDLVMIPEVDFYTLRLVFAAGGLLLLLYGLILESE